MTAFISGLSSFIFFRDFAMTKDSRFGILFASSSMKSLFSSRISEWETSGSRNFDAVGNGNPYRSIPMGDFFPSGLFMTAMYMSFTPVGNDAR